MDTSITHSLFLGIVQGLSEFLPLSSSGHLVLLPWIFGFPDPGLGFDVALHAGTLCAVLGYFWRDWLNLFRLRSDMPEYSEQPKLLFFLILATVPGVCAGVFFEHQAETIFRNPLLVAGTLFVFGAMLLAADIFGKKTKSFGMITIWDALSIGCAQALAIVPGVSRSGVTITAALARGVDRASAARFSFLLSTPIIVAALLSHARDLSVVGTSPIFAVGVLSSAISGYLAISYLIRFVERASYRVFFWYRAALAFFVVFLLFSRL
jgi:undecaprenyl-diphosphatase